MNRATTVPLRKLFCPALALLFIAVGCGEQLRGDAPRAREAFTPSTAGKKLLHYRGPGYEYMLNETEAMEKVAFDGLILGGGMAFQKPMDPAPLDDFAAKMAAVPFKRYSDNFYLCYSFPGQTADEFDWFDDLAWVAENWRIMAAAAKKAGFKGICFDSEYYESLPLFGYYRARHAGTKSIEDYQAQVRKQAAMIMRAVNEAYPDITITLLFGFSGTFYGVPQHPLARQENYTLVSAFVDGLLSECGDDATVHDMHEQSFSFRVPGSYARTRAMMKELLPEHSAVPDAYRKHHRAGFSFWPDCWENASEGRPFHVDVLDDNYYTPAEFTYSLHNALAYSDKYVWMWPGVFDFWKGTARTLDADGKEVRKPIPEGYLQALHNAHNPQVPVPPRDRKPNTYRVLPAHSQQGWPDEPTFADLWDKHELIADLPAEWRFHTDPDEVGVQQGWYRPGYDDAGWPNLRIREFWEPQGYSPYDGQAWYRVAFTPPESARGKKLMLAFGAVSDEASVYVNGEQCYASRFGDNIRHRRFVLDVSDLLKPGEPNTIAVRVWNTGWCGGIWKNVKLIAPK